MGLEEEFAKLGLVQQAEAVAVLHQMRTELAEAGAHRPTLEERLKFCVDQAPRFKKMRDEDQEAASQFIEQVSKLKRKKERLPWLVRGAYFAVLKLKAAYTQEIFSTHLILQYAELSGWRNNRLHDIASFKNDKVVIAATAMKIQQQQADALDQMLGYARDLIRIYDSYMTAIKDCWMLLHPKARFPEEAQGQKARSN